MDNDFSFILTRTEQLRRQIRIIRRDEHSYRNQAHHSFSDMVEHQKRELQILAIREELKMLRGPRAA